MLDLAGREGTRPLSLLDGEHWPVVREGQLIWHRRYDPTITNITPMNQVFQIDVATVTAP